MWRLQLSLVKPGTSLAVGTWVAGTSVLAEVVHLALPRWEPLADALGLTALALWPWYLSLAVRAVRALATVAARRPLNGRILLTSVSTQSLVIAWHTVLPQSEPRDVALALVLAGIAFYACGIGLMLWLAARAATWRLREDGDATHCIVHGAMSISGLAATVSHALPVLWIGVIWCWVAGAFAVVEGAELARVVARVGKYGWRRGAFTYDVSQWSRNFTFGMFYAFTLAVHQAGLDGAEQPALRACQALVLSDGQYVVAMLLLVEIALFLLALLSRE